MTEQQMALNERLAACAGVGNVFGVEAPLFPMVLVIVGAVILFKPIIVHRTDSGDKRRGAQAPAA